MTLCSITVKVDSIRKSFQKLSWLSDQAHTLHNAHLLLLKNDLGRTVFVK